MDEKNNAKEVDAMTTAARLQEDETIFAKELMQYVASLKKQSEQDPQAAYEEAKTALKRTGVTSRSGKTKRTIVSWE